MEPLDILTIIGAIGCYSYTAFLWKSDESHLEKVLKKNTLTCRLCNKTRNRSGIAKRLLWKCLLICE